MAASSSASLSMSKKYAVFLSFRGEDTRKNFTSHLYRALTDKEIETYIDSKSLDRGDEITPALLAAIQQSNIAVIVFSEHYASSSWCLAELVHILECHETEGLILLPVFYHVDPSDIRKQQGSYGVAFEKHEEKFEDSKVRAWRSALDKAANHSGWDSKDYRVETDLIDAIVRDILGKLNNLGRKLSQRGIELPTTTILEDEATSHKMRKKILACLLDENVSKIGVFGMGGIGKTTVLEHINNELVHNPKFDKVIFVTVSKAQDIKSLQDKIASDLQLELRKDADEKPRAAKLYQKLKESKRFVLILDDMWEEFALKDVGIPEPTSENGCKLVLTTRELDVCRMMKCQETIKMELLSEEEALNLFNNSIGGEVSTNPELKETIKLVAQECACLPLAIVTVAGSLWDNNNRDDWNIALEDLKKAESTQLSDKLMKSLKLSYDRLKDERHQECLLYCALYPEDYPIERDLLIDQLIAVVIVDETKVLPMERGQAMLNHLVKVSLLIDTVDDDNAECVKLHDSIRDMALQIMRENPTQFVAKAGESVESIPAEDIWNEDVKRVSLMQSKKFGISSSIEPPHCPKISTLLLNDTSLESIPKNFFQKMLQLNVLDLSDTYIEELPESVSLLLKLSVLLLMSCYKLKHVPDLSKLSNMRRLDLSWTKIEEFPDGIENMVKLTYLNLSGTKLSSLPTGSLCNLTNLRYLDLSDTNLSSLPTGSLCNLTNLQYLSLITNKLTITEDQLVNHRKLKTLRCNFAEFNHFNAYVRSLAERSLTNFSLRAGVIDIANSEDNNDVYLLKCDTTVSSESTDLPLFLPKNVEILAMDECRINVRSLCELTSIDNVTNLKELHISNSGDDLMYLFYYFPAIFPILERIDTLALIGLPSLRNFVGIEGEGAQPSLPAGSFSSLEFLYIADCGNIKKLFHLKNASFPNLRTIRITGCSQLEEIVWRSRENEIEEGGAAHHTTTIDVVTLPKLKRLELENLPKLQSIPFVDKDSLQELTIRKCPNLKRIPFLDREPWRPIKHVDIDEESWSSLEWNNLKDKDAYWRKLKRKRESDDEGSLEESDDEGSFEESDDEGSSEEE